MLQEERSALPHDLWGRLAPGDAEALSARGRVREFRTGQALCHERQVADRVLVLLAGRVKITVSSATGREVVLAFRGPGELVGELSALDHAPRSATVVALEPVRALAVAHDDFRAFLAEHPAASLELLRVLARRLRDADAKRLESASASALERVASRLLELCERFGEPDGDCIAITLPISQPELAGWAGASLESVGRALQTMRGLGWIETRRRGLRVTDLDALRRAAA
jgi:CRP/FNR family transcriptional regulator, cyclic AMP receptor protein